MVFLVLFLVGVLAGLIYVAIRVKSPAPPLTALAGLLGMWLAQALLRHFL